MLLFIYFFSGLSCLFFKERYHRVGWEDLGEVENPLIGGVGTQSGGHSSEECVGTDALFRQVFPSIYTLVFFLEVYMSPINTDTASHVHNSHF